eukprot:scaffold1584_cov259-Pinguiococcus_pyrenoidosus.AAC.5
MGAKCGAMRSGDLEDPPAPGRKDPHALQEPITCVAVVQQQPVVAIGRALIFPTQERKVDAHRRDITALCSCEIDAQRLFSTAKCGSFAVWRDSASVFQQKGHDAAATAVTGLSATRACSGGRDAALLVWDLTAQSVEDRRAKAGNVISCLETLQNGTLVAQGAEDLAVRFWDLRQPGAEPVQSVRGFSHSPLSVAVHPRDEHYVLTACKASNGFGGEARVLDRRKGEVVHCFPGHKADATGCAWVTGEQQSPSGICLVVLHRHGVCQPKVIVQIAASSLRASMALSGFGPSTPPPSCRESLTRIMMRTRAASRVSMGMVSKRRRRERPQILLSGARSGNATPAQSSLT